MTTNKDRSTDPSQLGAIISDNLPYECVPTLQVGNQAD
jgi:hypothetical protein